MKCNIFRLTTPNGGACEETLELTLDQLADYSIRQFECALPDSFTKEGLNNAKRAAKYIFIGEGNVRGHETTREAVIIDADDPGAAASVQKFLDDSGYAYISWETYKSGLAPDSQGVYHPDPSVRRERFIIPLDRPVAKEEWSVTGLLTLFPAADYKALGWSQPQFLPLTWSDDPAAMFINGPFEGKHLPAALFVGVGGVDVETTEIVDDTTEEATQKDLIALIKRASNWKSTKYYNILRSIKKGDAFLTPGEPSNEACKNLACFLRARLPTKTVESIALLVAPSLIVMQAERGGNGGETPESFLRMLKSVSKQMIVSARHEAEIEALATPGTELIRSAVDGVMGTVNEHRDEEDPWVLQEGNAFVFKCPDLGYTKILPAPEAATQYANLLYRARAPSSLYKKGGGEDGEKPYIVPVGEVLRACAVAVNQMQYTPGDAHWDAVNKVMHVACCQVRKDLVPTEHPHILAWLRASFPEDIESVLDWLAVYPCQDKPSRCLFMYGPTGIGKTLLTSGLAWVYGQRSGFKVDDYVGDFNDDILLCPMLYADEETKVSLNEIKQIIGGSMPKVNKKFANRISANIRLRLVMAANDLEIFSIEHGATAQSLAAVKERFLALTMVDARGLLKNAMRDSWHIDIAELVLWLRDNREVESNGRFFGRPGGFDITRAVALSSDGAQRACQLIASELKKRGSGRAVVASNPELFFVKDGIPHIKYEHLNACWKAYENKAPSAKQVKNALHALSLDSDSWNVTNPLTKKQGRYWRIDPKKLSSWLSSTGDYDDAEVLAWLTTDDAPKGNK